MLSSIRSVTQQPFVRYLSAKPLEESPEGQNTAPAQPHLKDVEKGFMAQQARRCVKVAGGVGALRLINGNTPLLALPKSATTQVADLFVGASNTAAAFAAVVKDATCLGLEGVSKNATYATRLPRLAARTAASLWFTTLGGLSQADVRAWRSRPDYEYPEDCDPRSFAPNPHCPVLAVGQRAEAIEPMVAAVLIGATGLALAYAMYRVDLAWRKPAAPAAARDVDEVRDVEAGLREPLLPELSDADVRQAAPVAPAGSVMPVRVSVTAIEDPSTRSASAEETPSPHRPTSPSTPLDIPTPRASRREESNTPLATSNGLGVPHTPPVGGFLTQDKDTLFKSVSKHG